jgi:hypothetical protein
MDAGDRIKVEPVPSSQEVQMEQSTGGKHRGTDFETKSAIYTPEALYGNDQTATLSTDDQLSDTPHTMPFGEHNLVTPDIPLKLEPCDDYLVKAENGEVVGDASQQYPIKHVKCETSPEPGMSGCRTEYIQTTDDQRPGFDKELFDSSYPSYVLGTEFSPTCPNTSCALDMKTEYIGSGMGDSQSECMKIENSDCEVEQSLTLKSEYSYGTDSTTQIKIEPGSVCSLGVTCKFEENHDMYNTQTVLKTEDAVKIEGQESKETRGELGQLDLSQDCMSESDPDVVWTKVEEVHVVSMISSFFLFFLMRLGMPQAILLIMATPSCGF